MKRKKEYDVLTSAPIAVKYKSNMDIPLPAVSELLQVYGRYMDKEEVTKYAAKYMQYYHDNLINVVQSKKRLPINTTLVDKLWDSDTIMSPVTYDGTTLDKIILQLEWQKAR